MKRTKKGFTLVELLVVIAILAILASVSVVGYTAFIKKANDSVASQELHQLATLIESELLVNREWSVEITTTSGEGENATTTKTTYTVKVVGTTLTITEGADIDAMLEAAGEVVNGELTLTADGTLTLVHTNGSTVSETLNF